MMSERQPGYSIRKTPELSGLSHQSIRITAVTKYDSKHMKVFLEYSQPTCTSDKKTKLMKLSDAEALQQYEAHKNFDALKEKNQIKRMARLRNSI